MTTAEITKLRELTASQMQCDCGEPLAITKRGLLCAAPGCIGKPSRQVFVHQVSHRSDGVVTTAHLARAWPERVVGHDKTERQQLKEFSKGIEKL